MRKLKPLNYLHEKVRKKVNKSLILSGKFESKSAKRVAIEKNIEKKEEETEKMAPIQKRVTEYLKTKKIEKFLK